MSKIKLTGDSSGYVELSAANNAGNKTLELPTDGDKILSNNNVGIVTATTFSGNLDGTSSLAQGLTGTPDITVGNINATGTITYDDVTNIDSVGVITARSGIDVTGGVITSDDYTITGISSSITDTAVDVFIYDTSKDSDGGAWRKRTQHTSWYNETLNTATRGSRREFPAVAVIVAETGQVTIYDGDDPDLPMWMVFNGTAGGASHNLLVNTGTFCLSALNGTVFMGALAIYVNFISEYSRGHRNSGGSLYWNGPYNGNIAERNAGKGSTQLGDKLVLGGTHDVAMTVLPNAQVDDATGLPVPTIAVATNAGISVVTDSGSVYDLTTGDVYDHYSKVEFGANNRLYYTAYDTQVLYSRAIPSADQNYTAYNTQNTNRVMFPTMDHGGFPSGHPVRLLGTNGGTNPLLIAKNKASGSNETSYAPSSFGIRPGLTFIDEGPTNPTSMVAYATKDYNTGWMHGDIKGAFLSDTDATNLVEGDILGGEGTFDDPSYWTAGASWTVSGGAATSSSSGISYLTKNGILTTGARYVITFTLSSYSAGTLYVYCGTGAPGNANHYLDASANGTYTMVLDAYNTNFGLYGSNFGGVVDNLTISSVVDRDRSKNVKDLGVIGTITKSPVATGAELVSYKGTTASTDRLELPYNNDYDFGTGDFSIMFWIRGDAYPSAWQRMFERKGGENFLTIRIHPQDSGTYQGEVMFKFGSAGWAATNYSIVGKGWLCMVFTRVSGTSKMYVNGVEQYSTTSHNGTVNNSSNGFMIDNNSIKLSLLRVSGSVPSAEQIKKIYEDEKVLFRENAKCTLYGSSDAVTALAYDEVTEQLHVGTSSGRSDFQGLCRINNTTTAVTTAISAHDEFIVEQ